MDVLDKSTPNDLSIISCSGIINEQQERKALFPVENDLVVVRLIVERGEKWNFTQINFVCV